MKKIFFWSIVSFFAVGIALGGFFWLGKPQVITLSGGTKLTLLGVTHGKHHAAPKIKSAGGRTRGGAARLDSTNDTLVVWIQAEHKPNNYEWQNYQLLVYDKADTACVSTWSRTQSQIRNNLDIQGFKLDAYPRWDSKIILRIMSWGNGERVAKGQFVVSNPARHSAAKWSAETVPDKQSDGDLDVTLTRFIYGVEGFQGGNRSSKDPANKAVLAAFRTEQNGILVTNWQPIRIETTDATGNNIENNSWSNRRENDEAVMTYQWGLWPNETPWKLRVEMSQSAGYADNELWTVQNVPVNPGRQQDLWNFDSRNNRNVPAFAETSLQGIHLKLFPVIQFTDQNQGNGEKRGGFRIQADQTLNGMQMTLVTATDEQGHVVPSWNGNGWGGDSRQFQFQNIRNAKFLNITMALHKSRFVEFTAKPEQAPAAAPKAQ